MSYPGIPCASYSIHTSAESVGYPAKQRIRTQLQLDDVDALPVVVKELAKMGYDLSDTAKALREVEEEQRKERRRNDLNALIKLNKEFAKKNRRFLIGFIDKQGIGRVDEGMAFRGQEGRVTVRMQGSENVDIYPSIEALRENYEFGSDLVTIEYLD